VEGLTRRMEEEESVRVKREGEGEKECFRRN
jgi:hypothetical protein